jgi:cation:H+ antiporter
VTAIVDETATEDFVAALRAQSRPYHSLHVTGKLGIILLAGGIVVTPSVLGWHLPPLIAVTGPGACFISTGRLRRWHGVALLALHLGYWTLSFALFGAPPIEMD